MTPRNEEKKFNFIEFIYYSYDNQYPPKAKKELSYINDTKDAFLRNVALALTEYYLIGGNFFYNSYKGDKHLCEHLNKWLNEKKLLYTSGGLCKKNNDLWNKYIETKIWNTLKEKYIMKKIENKEPEYHKDWCIRSENSDEIKFNSFWIPNTCDKEQNEKGECSFNTRDVSKENEFPHPPVTTCDCNNFVSREPVHGPSFEDHPESPPTSRSGIAPSMGYILFAVTIFCIILCKVI